MIRGLLCYTISVPMPRICACILCLSPRAFYPFGTILISVALGPEDIGRYPWYMPWDKCAQPFPFPLCILEPNCCAQTFSLEHYTMCSLSMGESDANLYERDIIPLHLAINKQVSWCELLGTNHFGPPNYNEFS